MKKIIISEQEKKYILSLYGLIKEGIDPETGGTIIIDNFYKPGFYSLESTDTVTNKPIKEKLDKALSEEVYKFVKLHPNSIVKIKFISSESAIPNSDREGLEGKNFLEVGQLSKLRKKYLEQYIVKFFENLKKTGDIENSVEIPPMEYEDKNEGGKFKTPWLGQPFCPANSSIEQQRSVCKDKYDKGKSTVYKDIKAAYDSEQFSQLEITVKLKTETTKYKPDCAAGLTIQIFVPKHKCQNAEFFVFANQTLLYNTKGGMTANLNNSDTAIGIPTSKTNPIFGAKQLNPGYGLLPNGDKTTQYGTDGDIGGYRSDTFIVTTEQSKQIVSEGNGKIVIWMLCTTSHAHDDIPTVKITKNVEGVETVIYEEKPNRTEGKLLVLDACGNALSDGGNENKPDASSYIQKLKNDKEYLKTNSKDDNMGTNKMDEKQPVLERAGELQDKGKNFMFEILKLKTDTETGNYTNTEINSIQSKIKDNYKTFYDLLTQEPSFEKNKNNKYSNKIINGELYGDVRRRIDEFYEVFDAIYKDDKGNVNPEGIQTSNGKLNLKKIVFELKKVRKKNFELG